MEIATGLELFFPLIPLIRKYLFGKESLPFFSVPLSKSLLSSYKSAMFIIIKRVNLPL